MPSIPIDSFLHRARGLLRFTPLLALLVVPLALTAQQPPGGSPPPRTIAVAGVVQDEAGRAVDGTTVIARRGRVENGYSIHNVPTLAAGYPHAGVPRRGERSVEVARLRTGRDGRFRFDVELDAESIREAHNPMRGAVFIPMIRIAAFTADLGTSMWVRAGAIPAGSAEASPTVVTLYPRPHLTVRVLDHESRPVADTDVIVAETVDAWMGRAFLTDSYRQHCAPLRFRGTTDADGRARFRPPFGANLQVECPAVHMLTIGDRPRLGTRRDMLADEGSNAPLRLARGETRELVLQRPPPVAIRGRVIADHDEFIPGMRVGYLGEHVEVDDDGRFAFERRLPAGGPLYVWPRYHGFHQEILSPAPNGGDIDVTIQMGRRPITVRVDRTDCTVALHWFQLGPRALTRRGGRLEARFDVGATTTADLIVTATDTDHPRIGFHVERARALDGPVLDIAIPDFGFDAALDVTIAGAPDEPIEGVVYLGCTGVDRYAGVPILAERLVAAAPTVRFPALQTGNYVVGFVPYAGNERLFAAPGEPRLATRPPPHGEEERVDWATSIAQRLGEARSGPHWRSVRIDKGANGITINVRDRAGIGRLEITPVDRRGRPLGELSAELFDATGLSAGRWHSGPNAAFVIEGVPSGVYELMLESVLTAFPYRRLPVVVPSAGTVRQRIALDVIAPAKRSPPLLAQAIARPNAAESSFHEMRAVLERCMRFLRFGQNEGARATAAPLFEHAATNGHAAGMLAVLLGGTDEERRTLPLTAPDAARLGLRASAGAAPGRRAVLDALWRKVVASEAYTTERVFRLGMNLLRLQHLLRYPADRESDGVAFRALIDTTRSALDHPACRSIERRYRKDLDALARKAAKAK